MGTTRIMLVFNQTESPMTVENLEGRHRDPVTIPPGSGYAFGWNVPWARSKEEFDEHHIKLAVPAGTNPICIWQNSDRDGDYVRYSTDGLYHCKAINGTPAMKVPGLPEVSGERRIEIDNEGFAFYGDIRFVPGE